MRGLFGECIGQPVREALVDLGPEAFSLMDTVLDEGRALARWIQHAGGEWRLTVAPRIDPGTGEVYGVSIYLRERSDQPVLHPRQPLA